MILRLLEHVNGNKQPTNNTTVPTLSGKLLLLHDEIASADNAASSIAHPLQGTPPLAGTGTFSCWTSSYSAGFRPQRITIHGQITFSDISLTKLLIQGVATPTNQASQVEEWLQYALKGWTLRETGMHAADNKIKHFPFMLLPREGKLRYLLLNKYR